jgi:MFS family permease
MIRDVRTDFAGSMQRLADAIRARLQRIEAGLPRTRFGRLGFAHAATSAADAAVSLALAGSLFFDLSPGAAKSKVLQYLIISLAPFVVVAPFVGPLVDRLGSRRRWALVATAVMKAVVCFFMAGQLQSLWLFPLAFTLLVCGKAAAVARSSLVPEIVRDERDLVRANSRLSLIAVLGAGVGLVPATATRELIGNPWVLRLACVIFVGAALAALRIRVLPSIDDARDADTPLRRERADVYSDAVRVNGFILAVFRGAVGLVMFLSLFSLRNAPLWWSGVTLGALSSGTSIGAAIADRLRAWKDEATLIQFATILVAVGAALCAVSGNRVAGAVAAGVVGIAASVSRLAFDAIVQRDQPMAGRGAAFARFETRFQLAWVLGALLATALEPPRRIGLLIVALAAVGGAVVATVGVPALEWLAAVRGKAIDGARKRAGLHERRRPHMASEPARGAAPHESASGTSETLVPNTDRTGSGALTLFDQDGTGTTTEMQRSSRPHLPITSVRPRKRT